MCWCGVKAAIHPSVNPVRPGSARAACWSPHRLKMSAGAAAQVLLKCLPLLKSQQCDPTALPRGRRTAARCTPRQGEHTLGQARRKWLVWGRQDPSGPERTASMGKPLEAPARTPRAPHSPPCSVPAPVGGRVGTSGDGHLSRAAAGRTNIYSCEDLEMRGTWSGLGGPRRSSGRAQGRPSVGAATPPGLPTLTALSSGSGTHGSPLENHPPSPTMRPGWVATPT